MPSNDATDNVDSPRCRIAIIGAQRARVAKVISIIVSNESSTGICVLPPSTHASESSDTLTHAVGIEYLPCVATFDSYTDDGGESIRYLAKIEYHGADGKQIRGSSLAPFFEVSGVNDGGGDIRTARGGTSELHLPGVAAVAIGCGIEAAEDATMIETFIRSMSAACTPGKSGMPIDSVMVERVEPNSEYSTMKEENEVYKAMDADEKAEATRCRTIGPGKMANFAFSLAEKVVVSATTSNDACGVSQSSSVVENEDKDSSSDFAAESSGKHNEGSRATDGKHENGADSMPKLPPRDPNKVQFACKLCRTILFGEEDLEDPPHTKASHEFSRRKHDRGGRGRASKCESVFLLEGLDWMGDIGAVEGKLHCPKCSSKVGLWKWVGAQCSCGTWVTPAIQIPLSRVDVMTPLSHGQSPGTHVSPAVVGPLANQFANSVTIGTSPEVDATNAGYSTTDGE